MATKKGSAKVKAKGTKVKQPQLAEVRDAVHSVVLNTTGALGEKLDKARAGITRVEEQGDKLQQGQDIIIETLKGLLELVQSLAAALTTVPDTGSTPTPATPPPVKANPKLQICPEPVKPELEAASPATGNVQDTNAQPAPTAPAAEPLRY